MPRLTVGNTQLYYEARGEGTPFMLIAGLGVHIGYWATIVDLLSAGHQVIYFDHRGSGRSSTPLGPYSVAQMAEDALAIADALGVEEFIPIGHSMGGFVTLHLAANHPQRIKKLVLYSTGASIHWAATRFIESVERVWTEVPTISTGTLTRMFTPWNWSPTVLSNSAQVEMLVQLAEANPYKMTVDGFRGQMQACFDFDGNPLLPEIKAPALVLSGEHDLLAPVSVQKHLQDNLPNARLILSDAGHNTHLESPNWFVDQILEFAE